MCDRPTIKKTALEVRRYRKDGREVQFHLLNDVTAVCPVAMMEYQGMRGLQLDWFMGKDGWARVRVGNSSEDAKSMNSDQLTVIS